MRHASPNRSASHYPGWSERAAHAELRDKTYAECAQLMSEYDLKPPFHAGSMKTAPAEMKTAMVKMVADFTKKAEQLATPSAD